MSDDLGKSSSASGREEGRSGESRRIVFDDFEIERRKHEEDEDARRSAVPRIKAIKDDLLGGGKRISSKLFKGPANDGASPLPEGSMEPPEPIYSSLDNPDTTYFTEEELSMVRVRKLPKPEPPSEKYEEEPAQSEAPVLIQAQTPIAPTTPEPPMVVAPEEAVDTPSEQFEALIEEPLFTAKQEEASIIEEAVEPKETPRQFTPEGEAEFDPSLKVFLDALRGFAKLPRRAGELRDPRKDFVLLLSELLDLVREHVGAQSALFFWVNSRKNQLVLECASLDDHPFQFLISERHLPIEHDAVSKIALKGTPQLIQSIPEKAEYDLIPYYNDTIGVRAFAGMPVIFGEALVAVLAVDSTVEDSFSQETLRILSNYSKIISGLVRSYIEAYDLLTSARTLRSARKLFGVSGSDVTAATGRDAERAADYILRSLGEAAGEIVEWQWLAAVSFDDAQRAWAISHLQARSGDAYLPPRTRIDLNDTIIGKCLRIGRSERIDSLTLQDVRYTLDEDRKRAEGHSFLVIPIRTAQKNYGALALEHSDPSRYSDVDIETLEHLARAAATSLEIFALNEVVAERALTDVLTGTLNRRGFKERLAEELARAKEFDEALSVVLFEIDDASKFEERFGQEDIDTIVLSLSNVLQYIKQPYDVLARIGEFTFAVLVIRMTDEEAFRWSEKVRQKIVSEVIALGRRSFSVTTSIGVAGARRNSSAEELLVCAKLALDKAKERGGNEVIVY
jgi:diguanylate cyclase (GGDEF)-like protein